MNAVTRPHLPIANISETSKHTFKGGTGFVDSIPEVGSACTDFAWRADQPINEGSGQGLNQVTSIDTEDSLLAVEKRVCNATVFLHIDILEE